jgi:hypothetical protein
MNTMVPLFAAFHRDHRFIVFIGIETVIVDIA